MEQLSFLEAPQPAGVAPVWPTLDEEQRAAAVAALARLIAKVAVESSPEPEEDDE